MPVPSEQAGSSCAHCGAALVADQRYCLSCGQPASPVRLAFLDALQGEQTRAGLVAPTIDMGAGGFAALADGRGANGWLRRYSGLLGLFSVLLMCLIVGLLVGHWVTQGNGNKVPAKQVVEVKGLSAAPAAAAAPSTTTPTSSSAATTATPKETAKEKAEAAKEAAKETKAEKAPPAKPVKVAPAKIKKLTQSSGKKHQEEINSLGATPIETG